MKDLRIIFYVVRIIEITIRILEKGFKYTTKFFRKKNTPKKSKINKIIRWKNEQAILHIFIYFIFL